jgi:predicted NodU family carbamoyl transferase
MSKSKNFLAIHTSHNGSISISVDGELIVHTEICRFNKFKYSPIPTFELIEKINSFNIFFDCVILTYQYDNCLPLWLEIVKKYINKTKDCKIYKSNDHHVFHASCALTFQQKNNIIVWDQEGKIKNFQGIEASEHFSLFKGSHVAYQEFYTKTKLNKKFKNILVNNDISLGDAYSLLCGQLGLKNNDNFPEGKAMALSSYGNFDDNLYSEIIKKGVFNNNFNKNYKNLKDTTTLNYTFTFQKCLEELSLKKLKKFELQDIFLTGGVSQNILNNSNLSNYYKVFVDPMCNDQGISLGSLNTLNNYKIKRKHPVYLGFKPNYNLSIFDKNFKVQNCSENEASDILFEKPLAIFQGPSEQGQRGLGNRSLLINPCIKNCIETINKIKKREWYRTFACSILEEKFLEYFENPNKTDSRYMMFVYKAKNNKINELRNVLSPKNLSRVQTVSAIDNLNYYNLIKSFYKKYNIPFLLNTSLNRPGDVIVENLEDLKRMMLKTSLEYAYLPDINKIIKKYGNN